MKRILAALFVLAVGATAAVGQIPGNFPAGTVYGNSSAATRPGRVETLNAILNQALCSTQGAIPSVVTATWSCLTPGAIGRPLVSGGAGANLSYAVLTVPGGGTGVVTLTGLALGNGTSAFSAYAGTSCTSQFVRSLSALGVATCDTVANADLATMAQSTIKGRAAGAGTGVPVDLTATQATAILNAMVGDSGSGGTKGLVPAPAAGDATKLLSGAGTYIAAGSGTVTSAVVAGTANNIAVSGTCTITTTGTCTVDLAAGRLTANAVTILTSGTDQTFTTAANTRMLRITVVGGGGAGGGAGTGAGNGAAGNQSCWKASGTACTTPLLVATGGGAGLGGAAPGTGGAGTGGNIANNTGNGGTWYGFLGVANAGGTGGGSCMQGAGRGGGALVAGTAGATNSGGGGGGGGSNNAAPDGGAGGGGAGCVVHIINSPAASYVYTIGGTATGGTAGTAGAVGGTGAAGQIIVEAFFNS